MRFVATVRRVGSSRDSGPGTKAFHLCWQAYQPASRGDPFYPPRASPGFHIPRCPTGALRVDTGLA